MVTIRELGEKYGGIISEFVSRYNDEGRDCETEKSESEMFNGLISSLRNGELLTEKQCMYSCSEKLYNEMETRAESEFEEKIKEGELQALKTISSRWKFILDRREIFENSFFYICYYGYLELAKWLLEIRPDNNIRAKDDYAFRLACQSGHLEIAKWLLSIRPDIDVRVKKDYAFRWTCHNGYLVVAKWLLEIRPDIDVRAADDHAFRSACYCGQLEVAKWLLEIRLDINIRVYNDYAFRLAYENGHLEVVKWLLEIRPELRELGLVTN